MAKVAMPSLYVRHPHVQDGGFWRFHMLDEGGLCSQNVQALGGGQGYAHEHSVTFVSNPTGHGVEMGGIIPTLVQCEDRYEAYVGLGDIEDVAKLQPVTARNAEFDVADADGIDSRTPQSFHGVARDAFEDLEIRCLRGNMASGASIENEREVSGACDVAAAGVISGGGHCGRDN